MAKSKKSDSKSTKKGKDPADDATVTGTLVSAPSGTGTATGVEKATRAEEDPRVGDGPRGSEREVAGEPQADLQGVKGPKNPGAGAEERARFTTNGTLAARLVGSPSGPVPASARTASKEQADRLIEQRDKDLEREAERRAGFVELTEDKLASMSAPEIRAVAEDRGYDMRYRGGRQATAREFLKLQGEDDRVG